MFQLLSPFVLFSLDQNIRCFEVFDEFYYILPLPADMALVRFLFDRLVDIAIGLFADGGEARDRG